MKNEYEVRGDVTAIFIDSPKYGRIETLISTIKLERMKEFPYRWSVAWNKNTQSFYAKGNIPKINGKQRYTTIRLHRWITNAPDDMQVDHFNHDTLDNTDSNLRVLANNHNMQNLKGAYANSSSGVRGVYWDGRKNRWYGLITLNQKSKYVGYFRDIKDAEKAVIEARAKYMPYSQEASI